MVQPRVRVPESGHLGKQGMAHDIASRKVRRARCEIVHLTWIGRQFVEFFEPIRLNDIFPAIRVQASLQ